MSTCGADEALRVLFAYPDGIDSRDLSEDRRALPEVAGKDFVKNIFSFCRHFLPKPLASARQRCYSGTNILS